MLVLIASWLYINRHEHKLSVRRLLAITVGTLGILLMSGSIMWNAISSASINHPLDFILPMKGLGATLFILGMFLNFLAVLISPLNTRGSILMAQRKKHKGDNP